MEKLIGVVLLVALIALWIFSASRDQQSVGQVQTTVQAQMTVVAGPTASPTP